jgi:hypothetical protein
MVKDICHVDLRGTDQDPRSFGLEVLRTVALVRKHVNDVLGANL